MKLFKLAGLKIFRYPKHYLSVFFLLTLMYICVFFVSDCLLSTNKYERNDENIMYHDRRIGVYAKNMTEFQLLANAPEHEHILFYTTSFYHAGKTNLGNEIFDGRISFSGIDLETTKVKIDITEANTENFIIVPEKFTPTSENKSESFISGESLIGTEIIYNIVKSYMDEEGNHYGVDTGETVTFTVIGTYNSNDYMNGNSECLISFENLCYIDEKESNLSYNMGSKGLLYAIVDDRENIDEVLFFLRGQGFTVSEPNGTGIMWLIAKTVMFLIAAVATVAASVNLFATVLSATDRRKHQMAIFKAVGYTNRQIFTLNLFEYLIPNFIALIVSIIVTILIISATYSTGMNNTSRFMFDFEIFGSSLLLCLVLGLVVVTIAAMAGLIRFNSFDFKYLTETEDE